jgi:type VI protein secretion system component VasK
VPLIARLKHSFESKVASYEAVAGLALCAAIAFVFLLAAAVAWLATIVGFIEASLIFSGIFIFLALCFWLFGRAKSKQATEELTGAKQSVSDTVHAASKTVESLATMPKTAGKADTLFAGALILILLFAGTWGSQRKLNEPFP